jgi:poly(3-hydroxybutyrate) depolymerase
MKPFSQVLLNALGAILLMGVILLFLAPGSAEAGPFTLGLGNHHRSLMFGGVERYYEVHVPGSYDRARPSPVIFNFHGGGGNPKGLS